MLKPFQPNHPVNDLNIENDILDNRQNLTSIGNEQQGLIRLYVTLKKVDQDGGTNYKKIIIMTPTTQKISMLKRQIEKEFSDLFPKEPAFICSKLEDEYGYSLSNTTYIYELLKNGDRVYAIPEQFMTGEDAENMHLTGDINELLFMLKGIQQNIAAKLADCQFNDYGNIEEVLAFVIPLGFSQSKLITHNISVILNKLFATERLQVFEDRRNILIFNLLIHLINFWVADLMFADNFLLNNIVDLLEILTKSVVFSQQIKSPTLISNLMRGSKLDFVSAQIRSRMIKIITYLSKGEYVDSYQPQRPSSYNQDQRFISSKQNTYNLFQRQPPIQRNNLNNSRFNQQDFQQQLPNGRYQPIQQQQLQKEQRPNSKLLDDFPRSLNQSYQQQNRGGGSQVNSFVYEQPRQMQQQSQNQFQRSLKNEIQQQNNQNTQYRSRPPSYRTDKPQAMPSYQQKFAVSDLVQDYLSLLNPENNQEMLIFAVQNLSEIIDQVIMEIMSDTGAYLKCLNLIEIHMPGDLQDMQIHILDILNKNMNANRAVEGLQNRVIPRLIKGFVYQPQQFQRIFLNMIQSHLSLGKFKVDVPTIIAMVNCQFPKLQELGVKILAQLADPNITDFQNYDIQFENHIKFLVEVTLDKNKSYEFKNYALETIANLALKDSLRQPILYNRGIETLLYHLRNEANLDGQRIAAKGLLNLSLKSRKHLFWFLLKLVIGEIKLEIVTNIAEEIRKMHKDTLDKIVAGYLSTLVQKNNQYSY